MNEEFDGMEEYEAEGGFGEHSFMEIFDELSFKEKWAKVKWGLGQPKESGDYKYAKLQMLRLSAPFLAVILPVVFVTLLVLFAAITPPPPPTAEVIMVEPEEAPELEEIEEIKEEPPEPPEPVEMDFTPDVTAVDTPSPAPPTDFSPMPAEFDAVAIVKSPVIMKNIYGSRNPGSRGSLIAGYGGSGKGEVCVLRALRWLKKHQESDGSWSGKGAYNGNNMGGHQANVAYASMGLLAYLAHGETPASEEFGATVEAAIKYIVSNQGADGRWPKNIADGHEYSLPIAAYALSEAYGLTKVPMLKEAAEKAIKIVVAGQHPSGGWDYNCKQSERDDTSYMGWCAQSLKAAKMAGLDVPNLVTAISKAPAGFRKNCNAAEGNFGYNGPGRGKSGLTGVGVLCMQLMGESKALEAQNGLNTISTKSRVGWGESGQGEIYYWYYDTQAMFHAGGEHWKAWNAVFSPQLVENQIIEKEAIADAKGKMVDIGYWDAPAVVNGGNNSHGAGRVQDTILCTLQLEVYYRYLPTFKTPKAEPEVEIADEGDDIDIDIEI